MTTLRDASVTPRRARGRALARIVALLGALALVRVIAWAAPYQRCDGVWTRIDMVESCGACGVRCAAEHASAACVNGACALACEAHHADCDGHPANGCEVDLMTDRAHCGLCARSCGGARCEEGRCVARLVGRGAAIAVAGEAVIALWHGVAKYPLDGSEPAMLASGEGLEDEARIAPNAITLRDGHVRWAAPPRRVFSTSLGGGPVIEERPGPADQALFAPAEARIRLVDGAESYEVEPLADGGAVVKRAGAPVIAHPSAIRALAQNGSHLFWVDDRYRIFMAPKRP
jgi:hypothetical protein